MERSLNIFQKHIDDEPITTKSLSAGWIEIENNTIEIPSIVDDSDKPTITIDLFVMVDGNDTEEGNNTFYIVSNERWVTVIRNRCEVKLVVPFNYSTEERDAVVSFFHGVDTDVFTNLTIKQYGNVYSVKITCDNPGIIGIEGEEGEEEKVVKFESLANFFDEQKYRFYVECSGGKNDFKIKKPKKYMIDTLETTSEINGEIVTEQKEFILPDTYDNIFDISKFVEEDTGRIGFDLINRGNINCNYVIQATRDDDEEETETIATKELVVDNFFYIITVSHINDIDTIDYLKIKYEKTDTDMTEKPKKIGTINVLPPSEKMPNYFDDDESDSDDDFEPYMTSSETVITFTAAKETKTLTVETIPEDSAIFFKKSGTFIDSVVIEGHEIRITVKSNPFRAERSCLCHIINAEYQQLTIPIIIKQEGIGTR